MAKLNLGFLFVCLFNLFILSVRRLSLVVVIRNYSPLQCVCFSLRWLLLLRSTGSRHTGFSSCGTWAQQLWHPGSVVVAHGLSCSTACGIFSDQGSNPCPLHWHRWILSHCATREALNLGFNYIKPRNIVQTETMSIYFLKQIKWNIKTFTHQTNISLSGIMDTGGSY